MLVLLCLALLTIYDANRCCTGFPTDSTSSLPICEMSGHLISLWGGGISDSFVNSSAAGRWIDERSGSYANTYLQEWPNAEKNEFVLYLKYNNKDSAQLAKALQRISQDELCGFNPESLAAKEASQPYAPLALNRLGAKWLHWLRRHRDYYFSWQDAHRLIATNGRSNLWEYETDKNENENELFGPDGSGEEDRKWKEKVNANTEEIAVYSGDEPPEGSAEIPNSDKNDKQLYSSETQYKTFNTHKVKCKQVSCLALYRGNSTDFELGPENPTNSSKISLCSVAPRHSTRALYHSALTLDFAQKALMTAVKVWEDLCATPMSQHCPAEALQRRREAEDALRSLENRYASVSRQLVPEDGVIFENLMFDDVSMEPQNEDTN